MERFVKDIIWGVIILTMYFLDKSLNPNPEVSTAWVQLVALGASALGGILQGASQRRQAKQLEAQNVRPNYQQNQFVAQNRAIAQNMSRVGLPEQVYNNQLQQIQQNQAQGLRFLANRSNLPINVNSFVRNSNQAVGNLNAQDAQARAQWTQQLMGANSAMANEDRLAFQDQLNQWQFNANNVASMRRAGTQNIWNSLGLLAQGAVSGVFNGIRPNSGTANRVPTSTIPQVQTTGLTQLSNPTPYIPSTIPYNRLF